MNHNIIIGILIILLILLIFILLDSTCTGEEYFKNSIKHDIRTSKSKSNNNAATAALYYKYARKHEENPELIRRYEPNINIVNNCILSYKMAYKYGYNEAIFDIGRIYQFGIANRGHNPDKAYKYYKFCYTLPNITDNTKSLIVDNIIILSTENNTDKYINGLLRVVTNGAHRYELTHNLQNNVLVEPGMDREFIHILEDINNYDVIGDVVDVVINNAIYAFTTEPHRVNVVDKQNVHDTAYGNTMKENLNNMTASSTPVLKTTIMDAITRSNNNENVKSTALQVLHTVFNKNTYLSKYDKKEVDILSIVWNRINELPNKNDAIEMLVVQLSEAYEGGNVVCATGRVMHILSTLDGLDSNFKSGVTKNITNIMVKDKLHNELLESASKLNDASTLEGKELQNYIRTELYKKYVSGGIMSEHDFVEDVDSWIEYI